MTITQDLFFGILIGIGFTTFVLFLFRDIFILHLLNNSSVIPIKTSTHQGDYSEIDDINSKIQKLMDSNLLKEIDQKTHTYAKVLLETRQGLAILLDSTEPTPDIEDYLNNIAHCIESIDNELDALEDLGIIERTPI